MSTLVEEKKPMPTLSPPALPQQQPDGTWAMTCLRCTSTTTQARSLSNALVEHSTSHHCRG